MFLDDFGSFGSYQIIPISRFLSLMGRNSWVPRLHLASTWRLRLKGTQGIYVFINVFDEF